GMIVRNSSTTISDIVIRDASERMSDGSGGIGVVIESSSRVTARRLFVERSVLDGIAIAASTATLTDVVVREVRASSVVPATRGLGIEVTNSTVRIARASIEGVLKSYAALQLVVSKGTIEDARLRD